MGRWRRLAPPLAVGLLAAAAAFGAVGLLTRDEDPRPAAGGEAAPSARDSLSGGRAVFVRMGCGGCHRLAAARSEGAIGPDLDERLPGHTRESLTSAIVAPPASGQVGQMPTDYGERLSPDELDDLITFLLDVRESGSPEARGREIHRSADYGRTLR
ncbi:MAG: c-type cytochrome [Solirubrobacterales bacterium]